MYPLKFKPILKPLIWGGEKIAPFKGIETDLHNIGESWEISCVPDNVSVVENGPLAGKPLTELIAEYKDRLVGKANYEKNGTEFPLLVKFIDARQDLSIQVHPDDSMALRKHNQQNGKTEMWYVINTGEGAHLMSGLSRKITPEEYVRRIEDHTITDVLHDYKLTPGDVFFLPAGRIHSIGAGSFIAEIQQTSDLTYRIYDFGRVGLDGKPRQLHTELAKEAIDYTVLDDYQTHYTEKKNEETVLVSCKYFTTSLIWTDMNFVKDLSALDSFLIIICTEGKGEIADNEGNRESIRRGETVLIPASTTSVEFIPDGNLKVLTSFV